MDEAISAADANREFVRLLREVQAGRSFVVTVMESPSLALLLLSKRGCHAKSVLLDRLAKEKTIEIGRWSREEVYEPGQ